MGLRQILSVSQGGCTQVHGREEVWDAPKPGEPSLCWQLALETQQWLWGEDMSCTLSVPSSVAERVAARQLVPS